MMFDENDHVHIKGTNANGIIIDIHSLSDGRVRYTVESDTEDPIDDPEAWNEIRFPQLICDEDRLERI